jgi:hypothetical protein
MHGQHRPDKAAEKQKTLNPAECYHLKRKVRALFRRMTGHTDHYLTDDRLGRSFLKLLLELGLQSEIADSIAPWMAAQDMHDMREAAARQPPTRERIERFGREIRLTAEMRDRCKAWWTQPIDPEAMEEIQREKRRKAKAAKRAKREARLRATDRPPRQVAVLAAIDRLRGCDADRSITGIIAKISRHPEDRAKFPAPLPSFVTEVYRAVERLQRDGLVCIWQSYTYRMVFLTENYCRFLTDTPDEVLDGSDSENA